MKGSVFLEERQVGSGKLFSKQSSETLTCLPSIPFSSPALGKVAASACLRVTSTGLVDNYSTWVCGSLLLISPGERWLLLPKVSCRLQRYSYSPPDPSIICSELDRKPIAGF